MKYATITQTGFMATNILNGTTPVKQYQPTTVDESKENKNRLVYIDLPFYTIRTANGETITIKGARAWKKWSSENEYTTDF